MLSWESVLWFQLSAIVGFLPPASSGCFDDVALQAIRHHGLLYLAYAAADIKSLR